MAKTEDRGQTRTPEDATNLVARGENEVDDSPTAT